MIVYIVIVSSMSIYYTWGFVKYIETPLLISKVQNLYINIRRNNGDTKITKITKTYDQLKG